MAAHQHHAPATARGLTVVSDALWDHRALTLIKRTAAADATEEEFETFITTCRALHLDPRRKQAYCLVYNKKNPAKRRMSIIVGIDGFRTVAARTGNYRPDEGEPEFAYDPALKDPVLNPLGLVKATVRIWQHSHGEWHPITGVAYWDEYAPINDEWAEGEDGKRRKTGKRTLDGMWPTRPRGQLAKCAEALALRKGWPDDFSNVYGEEESDRSRVLDLTATEIIEEGAKAERQARLGGPSVLIDWCDGEPLEAVRIGRFTDRFLAWHEERLKENAPDRVVFWGERNRHALKEFWAHAPGEALEIKKHLEAAKVEDERQAKLEAEEEKP